MNTEFVNPHKRQELILLTCWERSLLRCLSKIIFLTYLSFLNFLSSSQAVASAGTADHPQRPGHRPVAAAARRGDATTGRGEHPGHVRGGAALGAHSARRGAESALWPGCAKPPGTRRIAAGQPAGAVWPGAVHPPGVA